MVANRSWALFAALGAVLGSCPAQAACWSEQEAAASRVRELQAMLMVAALRCHAAGIDIVPQYNGLISAERELLDAANTEIKRHFSVDGGQVAYDRFATSLANSYGSASSSPADCAEAARITVAATASPGDLLHMAALHVFPRALPDGTCAEPKSSFAAIVAASVQPVERTATAVPAAAATELAMSDPDLRAGLDQPGLADRLPAATAVLATAEPDPSPLADTIGSSMAFALP